MTRKRAKAPTHLTRATAKWWRGVTDDYELEPHHVRLLTLATEAFDTCEQAREIIAKDGLTIPTGDGGLKAHPAVAIKRDARLAFARLIRKPDLDIAPPAETRPRLGCDPTGGSNMPQKRRRTMRRTDPVTEVEAWAATFAGGWDVFGDLRPFGLDTPAAVREAAPEAWRRLGRLYIDRDLGADFNSGTGGSWALARFGQPSCQ